jgi:hypothetical protein
MFAKTKFSSWGSLLAPYLLISKGTFAGEPPEEFINRHTRTKGRVVESAGTRTLSKRSGPNGWNNRPWCESGGGRQGTGPIARAWNGSSPGF